MKIVITGAAGFIGSHLSEALLASGHDVTGVDQIGAHPAKFVKEDNLKEAIRHPRFVWMPADLLSIDLDALFADADVVFHLAGIAGVRGSWGSSFKDYLHANVLLTQNVLEACKRAPRLKKLVYASSSSVYGGGGGAYSSEDSPTRPISPYGLTKLAGEQLCHVYHHEFGVPYTALRFFTVYGPRQRPDMGFHRFMKAALFDEPLPLYGNGEQTRDFTYVSDLVQANVAAMTYGVHGTVFNVGGVETATVNDVLRRIETLAGKPLRIERLPEQPGDPFATRADVSLARRELGYAPAVSLEEGMARQWAYIVRLYGSEVKP
ncbi:NAD-dependent epimerase/dehydratase family protein [Paenibacillus antri]|uniref:NAD-dependent epimerase/dehydratase family protein n=1 Tax=Paenibacillus antri TaxID=2582848 RepID=A0A5R9GAI6_9BACL|nr:NAD-dependent epimerase/dehydratase family protein [Paenibacillus antri]TLS53477.1 NAD-dependent epimerase/dehydratase family protein [Paenibacillus antri]